MFDWFKRKTPTQRETVRFDDGCVTRTMPDGRKESVRWEDLQEVLIVTTDEGPFADDVFWVLRGAESGCVLPSRAEKMTDLIGRLQRLPGFDNEAVIRAMGCTADNQFVAWRRLIVGKVRKKP